MSQEIYKVRPCYCGGVVFWRQKSDKRANMGWRWKLVTCFPGSEEEFKVWANERKCKIVGGGV